MCCFSFSHVFRSNEAVEGARIVVRVDDVSGVIVEAGEALFARTTEAYDVT